MESNTDSGVIAVVGHSLSRVQLCDPMDSQASLPSLSELAQIHVRLSPWCHPTILFSIALFSSCLQSFPEWRSFLMRQLFALGGQSIGASALTSVFPMNIQGWFPLGLTGFISLLFKEPSRVFSSTIIQKHQFIKSCRNPVQKCPWL